MNKKGEIAVSTRLTAKQIRDKYPNQWVALDEIEYEDDAMLNVKTAVVVCGMSDSEYHSKCLEFTLQGKDYLYLRTADVGDFLGVML